MFCVLGAYRDIFGKAGQGVHAWRTPFLDFAATDLLFTLAFTVLVSWWRRLSVEDGVRLFVVVWAIGIVMHKLVCI